MQLTIDQHQGISATTGSVKSFMKKTWKKRPLAEIFSPPKAPQIGVKGRLEGENILGMGLNFRGRKPQNVQSLDTVLVSSLFQQNF